jgi:uncharacterized membrane protein HdeD (DUF308 family)
MTGVVAVLLGISGWTGWPLAQYRLVALCLALDFICHGVNWSTVGLVERKYHLTPAIGQTQEILV